jgi:MFS family permease
MSGRVTGDENEPQRDKPSPTPVNHCTDVERYSLDGTPSDVVNFSTQYNLVQAAVEDKREKLGHRLIHTHTAPLDSHDIELQEGDTAGTPPPQRPGLSLRGRSHVSLRGGQGFSLARSQPRQPIARDWSDGRKRYVASVACISTALLGVLVGIYAGLVPSIQYYIVDLNHYAILGNVVFYFGLAIPSFFLWPLPLLHGRKPYILSSLVIAMPLLFPQAIAVSQIRSPYTSQWRWALLAPRGFMGLALGFASMNFHSVLMDLFGASLMSGNPHQEVVDAHDVRRHGGGMGVWLGIWTWCFIGSLGIGFLVGAAVINSLNPAWGFYISIILIVVVLILNVFCPEVRRSAYRRSVVEVRKGTDVSRRLARGEVKMHRVKDGPTWWGQEVYHGVLLSLEMLRQPGFAIIAVYTGWIYAQVVLIIVLLGSLTSRSYRLRSPIVGSCVVFISVGALIAVPFQKANMFSRGRHHQGMTNELTMVDRQFSWTSHLLRRAIFCIVLPLVGIAYTMSSGGPPIPVEVPVLFAGLIGHLSGLAISECNGLIMETFDTSDLQPGMTGRRRGMSSKSPKRTNYSSFPRVTAGLACCHTFGFIFAAGATALGGMAQRDLGQKEATGVVAGILLVLTVLLLAALVRFKNVQIIPDARKPEMEKWTHIRRESIRRRSVVPATGLRRWSLTPGHSDPAFANPLTEEEMWRPVIIGNPSSKERRVNVLELGHLTRWTEIRKKNRLIDESTHLNRAALGSARDAVVGEAQEIGAKAAGLVRSVSSRSLQRGFRGTPKATEASGERTPHPNIPGHRHTPGGGEGLSERDCVMGQPLSEEDEERAEETADEDEVIGLEEEYALKHEADGHIAGGHAAQVQNTSQS